MKNVLVIHGPNLNLLGERDPAFYGNVTFDKLNEMILERAEALGLHCEIFQSNHQAASGKKDDGWRSHQCRSIYTL